MEAALHNHEQKALKPRYLRGFAWRWNEELLERPAADFSLTAPPFPDPPIGVVEDQIAQATLAARPELFRIVTPIDVEQLEILLKDHPNRPLVVSTLKGLRNGFWPYADVETVSEPIALANHSSCSLKPQVLRDQRDSEIEARRFSEAFVTLQPGMRVTPLGLVPKPRSEKLRLITDHSAGTASLNDLIPRSERIVHYDTMHAFAPWLVHAARDPKRNRPPIAWKSDVSSAFRLLPMHRLWQIKQVVKVDDAYHVDRNMVFGNAASPRIWCTFFSLILWIATRKMSINCLHAFMDDAWGLEPAHILIPFGGRLVPLAQARFLTLLNRVRIPWSWDKQLHSQELEIIGFMVNTADLTISMEASKRAALVQALREFGDQPHRTLREVQQLTGWASWALNVFPMGRWALQSSWDKIAGKEWGRAKVPVNKIMKEDLAWLARCFETMDGLRLLEAESWRPDEAEQTFICDACPNGFGFWDPQSLMAYYGQYRNKSIYEAEATCVLAAAAMARSNVKRLLIYTDSMNSVDLYASHRPTEGTRPIIRAWTLLQLARSTTPRVLHLPGIKNTIADALSRGLLDAARNFERRLKIHAINPPDLEGAIA